MRSVQITLLMTTLVCADSGALAQASNGMNLGEPVADPLEVRFMPIPVATNGAGMGLRLANRGIVPQSVQWKVTTARSVTASCLGSDVPIPNK